MLHRRRSASNTTPAANAAEAEAMRALAGAVARIDAKLQEALEEQTQARTVTDLSVQYLRATVLDTKTDLALAVEHLASVCGMLADRMESERTERQALIETVAQLAKPAPLEIDLRPGEHVVGGSFDASVSEPVAYDIEPRRPRWGRADGAHQLPQRDPNAMTR